MAGDDKEVEAIFELSLFVKALRSGQCDRPLSCHARLVNINVDINKSNDVKSRFSGAVCNQISALITSSRCLR